jgi:hypothetical protein
MAPTDAPDQMPTQSPSQISMKVSGANSSSQLIPANAVAKAGSKCAKAGNTEVVKGKSYTCIKTGKKLTWNKGVVISAKTPNKTTPPMTAVPPAYIDPRRPIPPLTTSAPVVEDTDVTVLCTVAVETTTRPFLTLKSLLSVAISFPFHVTAVTLDIYQV